MSHFCANILNDLGLIISLSLLFAAGLAVYENPQVRQWVDESRRKIAIALHSLGDEVQPRRDSRSEDASTREDDSAEAEARRRKAREEILEKGRLMEERRRANQEKPPARAKSFDDLVDQDGNLRDEKSAAVNTTAVELTAGEDGLRKRNIEAKGREIGSTMANPFADETLIDFNSSESVASTSRQSQDRGQRTPIVSPSSATHTNLPSESPQDLHLTIDEASNHPSDQLVDLTPTTSTSSAHHDDLSELSNPAPSQPLHYWSVNEWAETTSASFYTPPQSEAGREAQQANTSTAADEATTAVEQAYSESDIDVVSEMSEGRSTPGSWTEVGSVVSEYE